MFKMQTTATELSYSGTKNQKKTRTYTVQVDAFHKTLDKSVSKTISVQVNASLVSKVGISDAIGIHLPDINFYGIASRMHTTPEFRNIRPFSRVDNSQLTVPY